MRAGPAHEVRIVGGQWKRSKLPVAGSDYMKVWEEYLAIQNGELRYTQGETAHVPGDQRM